MDSLNSDNEKKETALLWAKYKASPTPRLQATIANKYTSLVHKIAKAFIYKKPSVLDYDDIIQAGRIGLLDAIEKFDPNNDRKAQFQTYAAFRIRGAILDEINSMDWTPRSVRENIKNVIRSIEKYQSDSQREPSVDDIAEAANLDRESTRKVLQQMDKTFIIQVENDIIEMASPSTDHKHSELTSMINIALNEVLTEVERSFIVLKFYAGYTNKEIQIALHLKTSELKNIRESATNKLMEELENHKDRY